MNRVRSVARRWCAALVLLLLFWEGSQLASRVPWIATLGTSVHTLGLGDYSADPFMALAPLSMQVLDEARADSGTTSAGSPRTSPKPRGSPLSARKPTPPPTPRPSPPSTPTAQPTPTPTLPPTPLPTPTPIPTPTP